MIKSILLTKNIQKHNAELEKVLFFPFFIMINQ